jgi:hypothetical protein
LYPQLITFVSTHVLLGMALHFDNAALAELGALHYIRLWTAPYVGLPHDGGAGPLRAFHCQCCGVMLVANSTPAMMRRHVTSAKHLKAKAKFEKTETDVNDIIDAANKRNGGGDKGGKGGKKGGGGSGSATVIK